MQSNLLVSVIIPTKNSERTLERCLASTKNQNYPNIEIIIVDNYSTDKTEKIAQKYGEVYVKGAERSTQRNFGAEKAKGELLLFIDSDMELTSGVIAACVQEIIEKDKDIKGIIIPEVSIGEGFWAKCKALERSCYVGDETIEAARFFDKKAFFEFKGYDESLTGVEDWDLSQRLKKKYKISRIKSFIRHNEGRPSLLKLARKKYYYAQGLPAYLKKHPGSITREQSIYFLRPAFCRNWKKLIRHLILFFGMIVMLATEMIAAGAGFIKSRIYSNS